MNYPTNDRVRALLDYDPDAGIFTWRYRPPSDFSSFGQWESYNETHAGERAGWVAESAGGYCYRYIAIDGNSISEQRLAWLWWFGVIAEVVDHENGDTLDNRIANLRNVDIAGNAKNQKLRSNNTSGTLGVTKVSRKTLPSGWRAYIYVSRRMVNLGTFDDINQAIAARKAAEISHGFHPNHGRTVP
jgi:hypothetical protein